MKIAFLVDLDDTVFSSARKSKTLEGAKVACVDRDGMPSGFMGREQEALWSLMAAGGEVFPITARRPEAFARVGLPFGALASTDFGARLLVEGREERSWTEASAALAEGSRAALAEGWKAALSALRPAARDRLKLSMETLDGIEFYALAKHRPGEAELLDEFDTAVQAAAEGSGGALKKLRNGNNLVLAPCWVDKRRAAEEMAKRLRATHKMVVGVGDSASDWNFMRACDFAIFPGASQIGRSELGAIPNE